MHRKVHNLILRRYTLSDYTTIVETVTWGAAIVGVVASIAWAYGAHIQAIADVRKSFYDAQARVVEARAKLVQELSQKFSKQDLTDLLCIGSDENNAHDPVGWLQRFDWDS